MEAAEDEPSSSSDIGPGPKKLEAGPAPILFTGGGGGGASSSGGGGGASLSFLDFDFLILFPSLSRL